MSIVRFFYTVLFIDLSRCLEISVIFNCVSYEEQYRELIRVFRTVLLLFQVRQRRETLRNFVYELLVWL